MGFNRDNLISMQELSPALQEFLNSRASQASLDTHAGNTSIHVSTEDRSRWNGYDTRITNIENNTSTGGVGDVTSAQLQAAYDDLLRRINAITGGGTGSGGHQHVVLTGLLRHGETIPLPAGYTEAQCTWFVTPWHFNDSATVNDIKWFDCQYNGRTVIAMVESKPTSDCVVFYMIMGVK